MFLAALAAPGLCAAEIYGWIDGAGVVTYSNVPPPANVEVTQVIHEAPVPPQIAAQEAHGAEVEALKNRIRLLELEQARAHRVSVEYPPAPPAPPGAGCAYGGDCYADDGTYYPDLLLVGPSGRRHDRGNNGRRGGPPARGVTHTASARAALR